MLSRTYSLFFHCTLGHLNSSMLPLSWQNFTGSRNHHTLLRSLPGAHYPDFYVMFCCTFVILCLRKCREFWAECSLTSSHERGAWWLTTRDQIYLELDIKNDKIKLCWKQWRQNLAKSISSRTWKMPRLWLPVDQLNNKGLGTKKWHQTTQDGRRSVHDESTEAEIIQKWLFSQSKWLFSPRTREA